MRRAEAPRGWRRVALKRLFRIVNGSTPKSDDPAFWDGDIPWVTPDDLGALTVPEVASSERLITQEGYRSCGTSLVPAGSLVISTRAPIGYVAIATAAVCTNQGCKSLVPTGDLSARFFYYQLLGSRPELVSYGQGSTFAELATTKLGAISLLVPPGREQDAIASFLDRETAQIDALIDKKERLLALLEEKRTALITRAVTKGLDPAARMKESGVKWLGRVPAQWQLRRLRHLSPSLGVGVVVNPSQYIADDGVPFLYGSDILEGRILADHARRISREDSRRLPKSQLHAGDVVMVRVGAPGLTAVVPKELEGANCASVLVIRRSSSFDSNWLCYALNSRHVRSQVEMVQYGAAQEQFNVSHAADFMLCVPPLPEQQGIATFLDRSTAKIDALAALIRDAIALLSEYRTALISAAVTGQIDVRERTA